MNTPHQAPQPPALSQGHFDLLMSAIAAQGQARQNGQFLQGLQTGGGINGVLPNHNTGNTSKPPIDTATAMTLDQIFGHSGFSRAMSTAQSTPANQLTTPFYEILLQNLLASAAPTSPDLGTTTAGHVQQTRSGRISRPPVPPSMGQNDILRVLSVLSQPGMEVVRSAMDSAGLLEAYAQAAQDRAQIANEGEAEVARSRAVGEALRLLAAAQGGHGSQVTLHRGNAAVPSQGAADSGLASSKNGDAGGDGDGGQKGKKRTRKQLSESQRDNLDFQVDTSALALADQPRSFPAPPRGKGSRLAMSKDEILHRRRERNKASALASRLKKQDELDTAVEALRLKEEEVQELSRRCERLELELEAMRQTIITAGLQVPVVPSKPHSNTPSPVLPGHAHTAISSDHSSAVPVAPAAVPAMPTGSTQSDPPFQPSPFLFPFAAAYPPAPPLPPSGAQYDPNLHLHPNLGLGMGYIPQAYTPATTTGTMDTGAEQILDFNMFMNMDNMDDEADGDFEPETSPHRGSDSEGDGEGDDDDDGTTPSSKRSKRDKRRRNRHGLSVADADAEHEANDEDFIDPEMEDEDLFLPIEDVPIPEAYEYEYHPPTYPSQAHPLGHQTSPPSDVTGDLMKALKVDTRDQLAAVMQKLVDSATAANGDGEATEEGGEGGSAGGAGIAGVAPDVVDKLRNVLLMAQAQNLGQVGSKDGRHKAGQGVHAESNGKLKRQR